MKKIYRFLCFSLLFFSIFSVTSLSADQKESNLYYVNAQVLKILQHQNGYCVIYRRPGKAAGELYLPKKWFKLHINKAHMEKITQRTNPSISFFIKDGTCEYVKVYAPRNVNSRIWGTFQYPHEYDAKFDEAETIPLDL